MRAGHVLNHTCEGLERFQDLGMPECVPYISPEGQITGCETNKAKIVYCPFCGKNLRQK